MTFWVAGSALIAGLVRASLHTHAGAGLFAEGLFGYLAFTAWNYGLFSFTRQRLGQGTTSVEQLMGLWGRAQDIAIGLDRSETMAARNSELARMIEEQTAFSEKLPGIEPSIVPRRIGSLRCVMQVMRAQGLGDLSPAT